MIGTAERDSLDAFGYDQIVARDERILRFPHRGHIAIELNGGQDDSQTEKIGDSISGKLADGNVAPQQLPHD